MPKKRVVLTGASGYIAQRMIQPLQERYDLVCLDIVDKTRGGKAIPNIRIADLANGDRDTYREHFRGADAIVHCAFNSAPGMDATSWRDNSEPKFLAEHANIRMAYDVYKTAQRQASAGARPRRICAPRCKPENSADSGSTVWLREQDAFVLRHGAFL